MTITKTPQEVIQESIIYQLKHWTGFDGEKLAELCAIAIINDLIAWDYHMVSLKKRLGHE